MASRSVSGIASAVAFPEGVLPRKGDCCEIWLMPFCDVGAVVEGSVLIDVWARTGKTIVPTANNISRIREHEENRLVWSCIGLPLGWLLTSKCLQQLCLEQSDELSSITR